MNGYRGAKAVVAITPYGGSAALKGERPPKALPSRLAFGVVLGLALADLALLNMHLSPRLAAQGASESAPTQVAAAQVEPTPARAPAPTPSALAGSRDVPVTAKTAQAAEPAPPPPTPTAEPAPRLVEKAMPDIEFDRGSVKTTNIVAINGLKAVLAELVADPSRRLLIRGHTDRLGSEIGNVALSRRRAEAMRRWLVARGAPADRIDVEGVGQGEPASPGDGPVAWAKNRRVEIFWR